MQLTRKGVATIDQLKPDDDQTPSLLSVLTPGDGHDFEFEPPRATARQKDRGFNNRFGLIAYALGVVAVTFAVKSSTLNILAFLFDQPETRSNLLWMLPLGIATFAPIVLSTATWWLTCTSRATWRLHLLFVPVAIGFFVGGIRSFLYATHEIGVPIYDMKEADTVALGGSYLLLSLLVHLAALLTMGIARVQRRLSSV